MPARAARRSPAAPPHGGAASCVPRARAPACRRSREGKARTTSGRQSPSILAARGGLCTSCVSKWLRVWWVLPRPPLRDFLAAATAAGVVTGGGPPAVEWGEALRDAGSCWGCCDMCKRGLLPLLQAAAWGARGGRWRRPGSSVPQRRRRQRGIAPHHRRRRRGLPPCRRRHRTPPPPGCGARRSRRMSQIRMCLCCGVVGSYPARLPASPCVAAGARDAPSVRQ